MSLTQDFSSLNLFACPRLCPQFSTGLLRMYFGPSLDPSALGRPLKLLVCTKGRQYPAMILGRFEWGNALAYHGNCAALRSPSVVCAVILEFGYIGERCGCWS